MPIYIPKKDVLAKLRTAIEEPDTHSATGKRTVRLSDWDARALYAVLKGSDADWDLIGIEPEGPVEKRRAPRKDKGMPKKGDERQMDIEDFAGDEGGRESPKEGEHGSIGFGQLLMEAGVPKDVVQEMSDAGKKE